MDKNNFHTVLYTENLQKYAATFKSGNDYIDHFLKDPISLEKWYGKTYVWLVNEKIIGFYNIGVGCLKATEYPYYKIGGAIHINYFAVDQEYRHYFDSLSSLKTSDWLMQDLKDRINYIRDTCVGFSFITLNSTAQGHNLYLRSDFNDLDEDISLDRKDNEDECIPMYYSLDIEF